MEVRNRFKGLDLIDRVPEEVWTDVTISCYYLLVKISSSENLSCVKGVMLEVIEITFLALNKPYI